MARGRPFILIAILLSGGAASASTKAVKPRSVLPKKVHVQQVPAPRILTGREVFEKCSGSVFAITTKKGLGTCFAIYGSDIGLGPYTVILTCRHVVADSPYAYLSRPKDSTVALSTVLALSSELDIAALRNNRLSGINYRALLSVTRILSSLPVREENICLTALAEVGYE